MHLDLALSLEERRDDRVVVHLSLVPDEHNQVVIQGASVRLVGPSGEELCPRMLIPIAGALTGPLASLVELRTTATLPEGATIIANVWGPEGQVQEQCPAEPHLRLIDYAGATGSTPVALKEVDLRSPALAEWEQLHQNAPWTARPLRSPDVVGVIEAKDEPSAEELERDLGIDPEEAEWIEQLLREPDL